MKKIMPLVLVLFAFQVQSVSAQSLPISITGSIGGGLVLPQSDLKSGSFNLSSLTYPFSKTGYNISGKLKVDLPAFPLSVVGFLSYVSLSNDTSGTTSSGTAKITASASAFVIGAGVQYTLFPSPIVKPYVGLDAALSIISGSFKFNNVPNYQNITINPASRAGIGIGIGTLIEIPLSPISFDVEAKYRFANLIGKSFVIPTSLYPTSVELNDGASPFYSADTGRTINYITISVGVVFKLL